MKPHWKEQVGPCLFFFLLLGQKKKQKHKMQTAGSLRMSLWKRPCLPFSNHVNIGGRVQPKGERRAIISIRVQEKRIKQKFFIDCSHHLHVRRGYDSEMSCPFSPLFHSLPDNPKFSHSSLQNMLTWNLCVRKLFFFFSKCTYTSFLTFAALIKCSGLLDHLV